MHICRACGALKADEQFYWDRRGRLKSPDCRVCYSAQEVLRHHARRRRTFDHYGWFCICCGTSEDLSIDHVAGDGGRHRLEIFGVTRVGGSRFYGWLEAHGFPGGFQTMCLPCNKSKGTRDRCRLTH